MQKKSMILQNETAPHKYKGKNINFKILLGVILGLAIILRFYNLGTESYWIDEMSTVVEGQESLPQLLSSGRLDQPPAYYLLFHFWIKVLGTEEVSTRAFSVIAGLIAIFLLFLIGSKLFGKDVGLISAFLMAISEYQIYYSQQARFYSYFELTVLLSFLFFILALEKKQFIYFFLYALANALMMYAHTHGTFIIIAQSIYLIIYWRKYRHVFLPWLTTQFIFVILVSPYFYPLIFGAGGVESAVDKNIGGIPLPSTSDPIRSIYRFMFSARGERSWAMMALNYSIAAIFLLVSMWVYSIKNTNINSLLISLSNTWSETKQFLVLHASKVIFLICWLGLPIILPFILSFLLTPIYLDRYVISASPAFYLILAIVMVNIRKIIPTWAMICALIIMIFPSLFYYYSRDVHEQWQQVANYVQENSMGNDVIVFAPNQGIGIEEKTFNWYYHGNLDSYGLKSDLVDSNLVSKNIKQFITTYDRMWVIIRGNPNGSSGFYESFFLDPTHTDFILVSKNNFVGISVYLFEILETNK